MSNYRAVADAVIPAKPEVVYRIIADYQNAHPRILPRPPFTSLEVEEGGVGAGTRVRFGMQVMGKEQTFVSGIFEPEPGRVLVEQTLPDGPVTTFTVAPAQDGLAAQVTIATEGPARDGLAGWLERKMAESFLKGVYQKELKLLAEAARDLASAN